MIITITISIGVDTSQQAMMVHIRYVSVVTRSFSKRKSSSCSFDAIDTLGLSYSWSRSTCATSRGTIERRRSALDTRASPHGGGRAGASGNVLVGIGLENHTQRADNVEGRRSVLSGHLALLRVAVVGVFLGLLARGLERQLGLVEGRCSHCTFERSTSMSSRAHLAAATTAGGCGAARTMALVWAPTYRPRA